MAHDKGSRASACDVRCKRRIDEIGKFCQHGGPDPASSAFRGRSTSLGLQTDPRPSLQEAARHLVHYIN